MFAVTAAVTRVSVDGYIGTRPLPMFFINPRIQGATTPRAAEEIARTILAPFHRPEETLTVHVHEVLSEEVQPHDARATA